MNRHTQMAVVLALLGCLLLGSLALAAPTATTLPRWVLPGGGDLIETAPYSLHGTIGQSVVGPIGSGSTEIGAGFWGGVGATGGAGYHIYLPVVQCND
jgi:hypothetical protein